MIKSLNIAILGSTLPPVMGGLEVYTFELARQLVKKGHRVWLLGYQHYLNQNFKPYEIIQGVEIFRLPSKQKSLFGNKLFYFKKLAKKLKEINSVSPIDVIHANCVIPAGLGAYFFLRKNHNIPLVITSHGYEVLVRPRNLFYRFIAKQVFKRASFVIGVSDEVTKASIKAGADPEKTVNWVNPVDTERFNPEVSGEKIRKKYFISDDEIVILSLRRLHPKTGVQYLVESAPLILKENNKIKFLIVGEGILKEKLLEKIKSLNLEKNFIFVGSVSNELVPDYISASDISVFPSLAEATSIACLEVMAMGVPVVASDVGGLPEIIEDGYNGLLVPFPKTSSNYEDSKLSYEVIKKLAEKILILANNEELRKKMGQNASDKVRKNYSWESYLLKLIEVYWNLINGTQP